jgi:hypothetical protein
MGRVERLNAAYEKAKTVSRTRDEIFEAVETMPNAVEARRAAQVEDRAFLRYDNARMRAQRRG